MATQKSTPSVLASVFSLVAHTKYPRLTVDDAEKFVAAGHTCWETLQSAMIYKRRGYGLDTEMMISVLDLAKKFEYSDEDIAFVTGWIKSADNAKERKGILKLLNTLSLAEILEASPKGLPADQVVDLLRTCEPAEVLAWMKVNRRLGSEDVRMLTQAGLGLDRYTDTDVSPWEDLAKLRRGYTAAELLDPSGSASIARVVDAGYTKAQAKAIMAMATWYHDRRRVSGNAIQIVKIDGRRAHTLYDELRPEWIVARVVNADDALKANIAAACRRSPQHLAAVVMGADPKAAEAWARSGSKLGIIAEHCIQAGFGPELENAVFCNGIEAVKQMTKAQRAKAVRWARHGVAFAGAEEMRLAAKGLGIRITEAAVLEAVGVVYVYDLKAWAAAGVKDLATIAAMAKKRVNPTTYSSFAERGLSRSQMLEVLETNS